MTGSLQIGANGLHFNAVTESLGWQPAEPAAILDRSCFKVVPSAAILAGAIALRPGKDGQNLFQGMIETIAKPLERENGGERPPQAKAVLNAIGLILDRTDGVLIGWLEPGMPIPSLTIAADLKPADADAVIAATGLARAADGTVSIMAGPISFSLGRRGGCLIATTNPAGLDGVDW